MAFMTLSGSGCHFSLSCDSATPNSTHALKKIVSNTRILFTLKSQPFLSHKGGVFSKDKVLLFHLELFSPDFCMTKSFLPWSRTLSRPRPPRFQAEYHVFPLQTATSHRHTEMPLMSPQVPLLQSHQVRQRWIRSRTKLGMQTKQSTRAMKRPASATCARSMGRSSRTSPSSSWLINLMNLNPVP